jgi:Cu-Zn family superoxide dismutase
MKRCMIWGCLLAGCATADSELLPASATVAKPVQKPEPPPVTPMARRAKPVEVPVAAEARIDAIGGGPVTGAARFVVDRGVVTMDLAVNQAPQGTHAVSLQETCDSEHWNPTGTAHGRFDVAPFHLGDVGNFFAGENGHGSITFSTELWSVGTGLPNDVVGKVIAVRERRDDFSTQPVGGSGELIGCGRIELSQMTRPAVSMMGALIEN